MIFKTGDYLKKKNGTLFEHKWLFVKLTYVGDASCHSFLSIPKGMDLYIRHDKGGGGFINSNHVEQCSEEEMLRLTQLWQSCSELSNCVDEQYCHIREDNGQVKQKINMKCFPEVLYKFKYRYPGIPYNVYKCPVCDELHIGKTRQIVELK